MPDRETVIKGLEQCRVGHCDYRCPYVSINTGCRNQLSDDAITLLKEQEAIESINFGDRTEIMANLEGLTWDDWRMYHSDTEVQNIAKSAFDLLTALLKEKEAKWVYGEDETGVDGWRCSECNFFEPWFYDFDDDINFIKRYEHCPKCGRRMTSYTGKQEGR